MTVFVAISKDRNTVQIIARAEDDGAVGDLPIEIRTGQTFAGKSFAEWLALGEGKHEITPGTQP